MVRKRSDAVVGEVALYGARSCGHGYIARAPDGRMWGDGEPAMVWSLTTALWLALLDLRDAGIRGVVIVHAPGGDRAARVRNDGTLPTAGEVRWDAPVVVHVVSAEEIAVAVEDK